MDMKLRDGTRSPDWPKTDRRMRRWYRRKRMITARQQRRQRWQQNANIHVRVRHPEITVTEQ